MTIAPLSRSCLHVLLAMGLVLGLCQCSEPVDRRSDEATPLPTLAGWTESASTIVLTHGGVGSPPEWSRECQAGADWAALALDEDSPALDAAVVGTVFMENICRFNAGSGANIRLDGKTVQMDAAVMNSDGQFAAVAVIERVRNPVAVARALLETPHRLLAGDGATRFAHRLGFEDVTPNCPEAQTKYRQRIRWLLTAAQETEYENFDWRRYWNYDAEIPTLASLPPDSGVATESSAKENDTVGTVTRDRHGRFAATLSTGGTSFTLSGRVGDVPIYGCGGFAGPAGAVACTGYGEEIIRQALARMVYESLASGVDAREAVRRAAADFPSGNAVGIIAIGRDGWGVAANRRMAFGVAVSPPVP
jgi:beta-aspartyl-peptidase (threonine type)